MRLYCLVRRSHRAVQVTVAHFYFQLASKQLAGTYTACCIAPIRQEPLPSQVHEMLPGEIKAFKHFWPGEVFLDADKAFYREIGRGKVHRMNCFGFLWHFR